jgi:polysaccharide biosynthesis protein PslG
VPADRHNRRTARVTAIATLLAACAIVATSASAAVPGNFYGIVGATALSKGDFKRMGKAHVGSIRISVLWNAVQTTRRGPIYWGEVEKKVGRAAHHHISPLLVLEGTPHYESHGCGTTRCIRHIQLSSKGQRRDWTSFVKAAVERYGPRGSFWSAHPGIPYKPVRRWQIWNEESNPNERNSPALYSRLVKLADNAISSVDRHGKLILGGMAGKPNGRSNYAWNYLKGVYRHAGRRHFEGVALHPYSASVAGVGAQIRRIRKTMRSRHDRSTQLLITEIGWGSGGKRRHGGTGSRGQAFVVSPKQQKRRLASSFKLLRHHRKAWRIGGVFWYQWKDPTNPPDGLCAFCYSSGLYKANGHTAKPALAAYRRLAAKAR